jgi:DNA-binding NtrC family response regulator
MFEQSNVAALGGWEGRLKVTAITQESKAVVLLVMPSTERRCVFLSKLGALGTHLLAAESCLEARALMRSHEDVDVVVTDTTLSDGNWCDVLNHVLQQGSRANVVVASEAGDDRLWSEVLWRGAYDMLVEPVGLEEVERVIRGALRTAPPLSYYAQGVPA